MEVVNSRVIRLRAHANALMGTVRKNSKRKLLCLSGFTNFLMEILFSPPDNSEKRVAPSFLNFARQRMSALSLNIK